jgi:hypothetical protein
MFAISSLIYLYVSTEGVEGWWWHDAQEFENRFWTLCAFLSTVALLFAPDSPMVSISHWSRSFASSLVMIATTAAHVNDRRVHRNKIGQAAPIGRAESSHLISNEDDLFVAKMKTAQILAWLNSIDTFIIPSTLRNLFYKDSVVTVSKQIRDMLADATAKELNYILTHMTPSTDGGGPRKSKSSLGLLFYKIKDHKGEGTGLRCRSDILELTARTRLAHLNVNSRAHVLDAMMVMRLTANDKCDALVRNVIEHTKALDLSDLKCITDSKVRTGSRQSHLFLTH